MAAGMNAERFWSKVDCRGPEECWPWLGYRRASGEGIVGAGGRQVVVSRFAYELKHGALPEGSVVSLTCPERACCNPEHMEARTGLKTHCPAGHEYTPENTYEYPQSKGVGISRVCKTCIRERNDERRAAEREFVLDVCVRCEQWERSTPQLGAEDSLCSGCRYTLRRNPNAASLRYKRGSRSRPIEERFWTKVDVKGEQDCWEWLAGKDKNGYGRFGVGGKPKPAHRMAYELLVEEIPEGLVIDHLCRNASCVNPNHLEMVTINENGRRVGKRKEAHPEG